MLFDSDVLIWFHRGNTGAAVLVSSVVERFISVVTMLEVLQGAKNRRELDDIKDFLETFNFQVLPLTENIGSRAVVYVEEYGLSHGLCALDALIAATAAEQGLTLATANRRHFVCITGLHLKIFVP